MQRILSIFLLAIITIVSSGCGEDSATGPNSNGSMSAKVNGASWSATNIQSTYTSGVLALGGSQISGAENKQFNIQGLISAPGTYQLGLISPVTANYTEGSGSSVKIFSCTSGSLKVDEISASGAKGSFSLEMREQSSSGAGSATRSVTEGTFDVKF